MNTADEVQRPRPRPSRPNTAQKPDRTRWSKVLERWPTAVAIGMVALNWGGKESDEAVGSLGEVFLLLPLGYLILAKLRRRWATWPVVVGATATYIVLRVLDVVAPSIILVAVALIVLMWGAIGGQLHKPGVFRIQALGMIGFGALALVGLAIDPDLGRYLVAAGWFFHGIWDFVHLRLNKVVARSFAEWCGVVDVLIAAQLVFLV